MTRIVTNEDIKKYIPLVEKFIRDSVCRNWNESGIKSDDHDISLGNTGMSLDDFRQYLFAELVVGLQKYNPDYRTADGKSVKELTFVHTHLANRIGSQMKRLTRHRYGYAMWASSYEDFEDGHREEW